MAKNDVQFNIGAKDRTKAAFKSVRSGMKRVKKVASSMAAGLKKGFGVASRAIAGVSAALAGTVVEAVRFNTQMARAWTMMDGGTGSFIKMRKEIKQLSMEFGIAKSELADGLYNALSAGVPEDNVAEFLKVAAKAAVADGSDIATSVDGITAVLNAFNLESTDATRVADMMFKTVKGGKTTFRDLATYLADAAGTASAMGVAIEDVLGAASHLTKKTGNTSKAIISIRNMMLMLNKALGDGWSKTMSFQEALQKVYTNAKGSETALMEIFGKENLPAMLMLTGENAVDAANAVSEIGKSAGAMDDAFAKQDQFRHWHKGFQAVRALIDSIGKVLDSKLKPTIERVTEKIKDLAMNEGLWSAFADGYDKYAAPVLAQLEGLLDPSTREKSVSNLKDGLVAVGLDMGDGIMRILHKKAPAVGDAIGRAAKDAIANIGQDKLTDKQDRAAKKASMKKNRFGRDVVDSDSYKLNKSFMEDANRKKRLEAEGSALAGSNYGTSNYDTWRANMAAESNDPSLTDASSAGPLPVVVTNSAGTPAVDSAAASSSPYSAVASTGDGAMLMTGQGVVKATAEMVEELKRTGILLEEGGRLLLAANQKAEQAQAQVKNNRG